MDGARDVFMTGATGYMGRALAARLVERGQRVRALVRPGSEALLRASALPATILRPWYVLGPGHRWPMALVPAYWILERFAPTRDIARRLGLVTLGQMVAALAASVENPASAMRVLEVADIRRARMA